MDRKGQSEPPEEVDQLTLLIHAGCFPGKFPPPHVGTDIVVLHRDTPKIFESLTTIEHHVNGLQRHISQTTVPDNVQVIFLNVSFDFCISTRVDMRETDNSNNRDGIFDRSFVLTAIVNSRTKD